MKKILNLAGLICLMLIVGLAIVSCAKGGSPTQVIKKLHTAIEKGDAKTITELSTAEAGGIIVMFSEKLSGMIAESGGVASMSEKITGDTAVVTVTFKDGSTEDYDLVKEDGKWKVTINK